MDPIVFPRIVPEHLAHQCPRPDGMLVNTGLGPWLDVRRFARPGTLADGIEDWTDIIQAGIDCILNQFLNRRTLGPRPEEIARNVEFGTLYLPSGIYRLSGPLLIRIFDQLSPPLEDPAHATFFAFCGIEIAGDAPGISARAIERGTSHGTILRADFSQQPAIIMQGGRCVHLRNLIIEGQNNWVAQALGRGLDPRRPETHVRDSVYFSDLPPLPRNHPNSPYAAICVDPFFKGVPEDGRYPGLSAHYDIFGVTKDNKNVLAASTKLTIEGCLIRGFVTGIVLVPPGQLGEGAGSQPANAENIRIVDTTIESTVSAIAIGQSQSRNVVLSNVNIFGAKYAINCVGYGLGTGDCPSIFGGTISGVKYLFYVGPAGGNYAIEGLSAEGFWSMGQLFGGGRSDGYVFRGCRFSFGTSPSAGDLPSAPELSGHLLNFCNATFDGCTFLRSDADDAPLFLYNGGRLSLRGCRFLGGRARGLPFFVLNDGPQAWLSLTDCEARTTRGLIPLGDTLSGVQPSPLPATLATMTNTLLTVDRPEGPSLRWCTGVLPQLDLGSGQMGAFGNGRGVFIRPAAVEYSYDRLKDLLLPGDLLFTGSPVPRARLPQGNDPMENRDGRLLAGIFREIHKSGDEMIIVFDHAPAALVEDIARAPLTLRPLFMSYVPMVHHFTQGDFTNGVRTIANVKTEAGVDVSQAWRMGDRILAAGALLAGSYVVRVTDAPPAIEVSAAPLADGPQRLYDADVRELSAPR